MRREDPQGVLHLLVFSMNFWGLELPQVFSKVHA